MKFRLTTSSAVLFATVEASQFLVTWNDAGKGMTLQRTASLSNPKWEDVPGSEGTNRVTLPMTSASEFFRLFRPAPAGLLAWWPGDGNALDVVGGKDGSLRNGATFAPGVGGQAFSFDGVDDYLEVPLLLGGLSEGTVEFWFDVDSWDYTSAPDGIYLWACVEWLPQGPVSFDGMNLGTHRGATATGELIFGIFPWEAGQWFWAYSGVTPALNTWYHVAGTWRPTGIRIYVNGQLKGTHDYTGPMPSYALHNLVGCSSWPQSAIQGKVDELRLYSRALSESEIRAIYEAGGTGKVKPAL
jgi:hypothetical protein